MKEDVGGDGLCDISKEGKAGNAMLPSQPIAVLVVCVVAMHSYIFWEMFTGYGFGYRATP